MQSNNAAKVEGQPANPPVFQRPPGGSGGGNKKGTSAERRATHNAIERARRESLNGRFLQLAASLPAISDVRRPSKSLIVNKSLDFVADAMNREAIYRLKIDNMRDENAKLREQLNKFLTQAGLETVPEPPVDELPIPMAELRNKKRSGSINAAGGLNDVYDLEDDDGLFAAGSEGEGGGKNSPTSTSSAASSVRGSLSSSLPSGVTAFTPMPPAGVYGQQPSFLSVPANMAGMNGASPGASSTSEDANTRERNANGFEDAAGNWIQASTFDGQSLVSAAPRSQSMTYAGLTYSTPNGMVGQGSQARSVSGGQPQFAFDAANAGMPFILASNGQHMVPINQANFMQLRNAQQQQQLQLQFQLQQQQQHQQQQQQQQHFGAAFNPSSFFDGAPLQSASFMTAV